MYREEEKLCLKWNDFQENAISAFGTLREDREFADVTLACEDGQQVEAHRVILASSSPFFSNVLRRNKHQHPLIYMRGVKSEDLMALVDFLYYGEANVKQENLDSFLAVAEELQLKGLIGSSEERDMDDIKPPTKNEAPKPFDRRTSTNKDLIDINTYIDTVDSYTPWKGTVANTDFTLAADLQDLDEKIKSMMMFSENKTKSGKETARICKVCGKEDKFSNIKDHIEANHITGVSHSCDNCGKISKSKKGLKQHMRKHHN